MIMSHNLAMREIKFLNKNSFIFFWLVFSIIYATLFIGAEFYGSPVNGLTGVLTIAVLCLPVVWIVERYFRFLVSK